mmetsp:Transcript_4198/g.6824  ORF Transcript_4198/g.6824 Transcript_4198/m.6824 type:complete len:146 (+) Transcript_4198:32-469(+)
MIVGLSTLLLLSLSINVAQSLMFYLVPGVEKCFTDEYAYDVLVSGDYRVATPGQTNKRFSLKTTDSNGNIVFNNDNLREGKFAFTTATAGEFKFCVLDEWIGAAGSDPSSRLIEFNVHSGVEATDYSALAKKRTFETIGIGIASH